MKRKSGNRVAMISAMALFTLAAYADQVANDSKEVEVTADTFKCLAEMTPVKHFFVDNLLGNLEGTLAVANSDTGGTYPKGSVVQLFPDEIMVKHGEGWNLATRDWEFFEIDVTELNIGDSCHVSDLVAPEGVEIVPAAERAIVAVQAPRVVVEEVAEEIEGEEGVEEGDEAAATAEGETPADTEEKSDN